MNVVFTMVHNKDNGVMVMSEVSYDELDITPHDIEGITQQGYAEYMGWC